MSHGARPGRSWANLPSGTAGKLGRKRQRDKDPSSRSHHLCLSPDKRIAMFERGSIVIANGRRLLPGLLKPIAPDVFRAVGVAPHAEDEISADVVDGQTDGC